jgi:hypothetical protein
MPDDIMLEYDLHNKGHDGAVSVEIQKGIYGLPQASRIANERLVKHLTKHGYHQAKHTHGIFTHETHDITFSLVVNDFDIKYIHSRDTQHLINTLDSLNEITTNWTGSKYLRLTLDWDYKARTLDISMPGYIEKALQHFFHPLPPCPNTRPTLGPGQITAPRPNLQHRPTTLLPWTLLTKPASKKSLAPCSTMQGSLTTPCLYP